MAHTAPSRLPSRRLASFAVTIGVCSAGLTSPAQASIGQQSCQAGHSRIGERIAAADTVVAAEPIALTYRYDGDYREFTATYRVTEVAIGALAVGDTLVLHGRCRRVDDWQLRRGYVMNDCGHGAGTMPGFDGKKATKRLGTLVVAGDQLVGESGYGECPVFDPATASPATPAALALLGRVGELSPLGAVPVRRLRR